MFSMDMENIRVRPTVAEEEALSPGVIPHLAAALPLWNDKDGEEVQILRERVVRSFFRLSVMLRDFLPKCDIIIDQTSGDLPGVFFEEMAGRLRNGAEVRQFVVHAGVVPSRKRPNRIEGLESDLRDAYTSRTLGKKILIVTEHADEGETCETLAKVIRQVAEEYGEEPEILIAAVSVDPMFFSESAVKARKERWVWGEMGNIGVSAFHRVNVTAVPANMAQLAETMAPYILKP